MIMTHVLLLNVSHMFADKTYLIYCLINIGGMYGMPIDRYGAMPAAGPGAMVCSSGNSSVLPHANLC